MSLMRPLVRLLGVFFVIEGTAGVLGNGIDLFGQWRRAQEMDWPVPYDQALGWALASAFMLLPVWC